ncbi:helix-turn-helix transcriptional regulator [Rhizobium sp. AAP43]|uniref:helix-turn-helix transcriptional regulator n=1 Tax=Rhizobium sp. AAP43 TaxID=1523420 RepID=UPI0006B8AA62|nr:helix-turn-helix transcriptional regulator [Rhizobium sp. AAP43]
MVQHEVYFDVRMWLESQEAPDPAAFLIKLHSAFSARLLVYLDGSLAEGRLDVIRFHHYPTADHRRLARNLREQRHLPHVAALFSALEPTTIDWSPFVERRTRGEPDPSQSQPVAAVVYPLLTSAGHHACLIVIPSPSIDDIAAWRMANDRDIASLAAIFHARLTRSVEIHPPKHLTAVRLTRRERETLAWIAGGKSYWETAMILGITERTVRYFMANARRKLDVVNNSQAVAEAVWQGLIPRLIERPEQ